jgi:hypothetical protein
MNVCCLLESIVQNILHIYEGPPHVKAKESQGLISSNFTFNFMITYFHSIIQENSHVSL